MSLFPHRAPLTQEERSLRRQIIWRDSMALLSLFAITAILAVLTYFIFQSFSEHRKELARRWLMRGETALHNGQPIQAIDALRSALAYTPGQRSTEIELAEALAQAGPRRTREAVAYFNSLRESEPGNGLINLQLARLAARQNQQEAAIQYYQNALDGTWTGDGYVRRREVRLELANYLIDQKRYDRARDELITAAGNAPDDPQVLVVIAALMEKAQDPFSALRVYHSALKHEPHNFTALEGAGRSAFALGHYLEARDRLRAALDQTARPGNAQDAEDRAMLRNAEQILQMYPSPRLKVRDRAERVLALRQIALARLRSCLPPGSASAATAPSKPSSQAATATASKPAAPSSAKPAASAGGKPAPPAAPAQPTPSALVGLSMRWQQEPARVTRMDLERDPEFEQTEMQLIYDTEKITSQTCGAPTGNDALLLKIAQAPDMVEQQ
jgi:tetratricopeptide (TPR) repeat protein